MTQTAPPRAGIPETLAPGIRRVLAPNPSPMTYWGTNSYLIGEGDVVVLDPGPAMPVHHAALLGALEPGERIRHILVSHTHKDHSPLARPLAEATGAKAYAFGDALAGRSQVMAELEAAGLVAGGEGVDHAFRPDERLGDGDVLQGGGVAITALWTPGHMANHLCFAAGEALFTADHVMGWASTMISPPDGDLSAFRASCARLAARDDAVYYPGHGEPVTDPRARIAWLIAHRETREAQILASLGAGPATIPELVRRIYTDTPETLLAAAGRNVLAHLIDLTTRRLTGATPHLSATATFERLS